MQLTTPKCPSCGSHFRAEDFDPARGVLSCPHCRALLLVSGARDPASPPRVRPEVPLPARFALEELASGIEIRRRWFQPSFLFLAFFCVAWDGFLVFWYSLVLREGMPWILVVFPIAHLAVGVGLTYFTLAGFLNTTTIAVGSEELRIRHAPLPWPGVRRLAAQDVEQLYCKERVHRGKNSATTTYEVWAALRGRPARKLVAGLPEAEQALFLEQRIERALGLADMPVPSELPR